MALFELSLDQFVSGCLIPVNVLSSFKMDVSYSRIFN